MKILIIETNHKDKTFLGNELSNYYEIKLFKINEITNNKSIEEQTKIINKINKENKSYIIEGIINRELIFILNIVDQIIYINYNNKRNNNIEEYDKNELLKSINKYSKELIIIKNKKELKKYLNAVYKNDNYIE